MRRLTIALVTPAPAGSHTGNRVTALRWAKRLRELGHKAVIEQAYTGRTCDLLVALHASRSHASVMGYRRAHPDGPLVVALTGTDLYGDLEHDPPALESLALATRLVLLQPLGLRRLPEGFHDKARTIRQSARAPLESLLQPRDVFTVCVLGHLRDVKDPFLAAEAVLRLPANSRVRVQHLGEALDDATRTRAYAFEESTKGRWRWLGARRRGEALRILAGSALLALTSVAEGGANAVTEAIACGVPVVSTHIDGSLGILGENYPGYFPVGDADALAALLTRCESDTEFYAALRAQSEMLRPLVEPASERECWSNLLDELFTEAPST